MKAKKKIIEKDFVLENVTTIICYEEFYEIIEPLDEVRPFMLEG